MIVKAALLLFREVDGQNQLLFIKTHNRDFYIFPGGVQTENEKLESILHREAKENLGVELEKNNLVGVVNGYTPSGVPLKIHLYAVATKQTPTPRGEIEKLWWMSREEALHNVDSLTPIAIEEVFPLLKAKGIW